MKCIFSVRHIFNQYHIKINTKYLFNSILYINLNANSFIFTNHDPIKKEVMQNLLENLVNLNKNLK